MGRRTSAIHRSAAVLVAPALIPEIQLAPPNPLSQLRRALSGGATLLRSTIQGGVRIALELKMELKISFRTNDGEQSENDVVEPHEPLDLPELGPAESDIPAILNIVGNVHAAPIPLMGSLHGILERHAP